MSLDLLSLYQDLHQHPELSFSEFRTSRVIAQTLRQLGLDTTEAVGRTGVVGVLDNGAGPVVWLRADMDALPVEELTGLPYASTERALNAEGIEVPVMHACGHDMHITALIGALERLVETRGEWQGTIVAVFQPAEEIGSGAQAMIADGILERFPQPDVVLGQHVWDSPVGSVGVRAGIQLVASDNVTITMHGRGGHGSKPHATVDPVVMAAATVMRLQTIVARDLNPHELAVVTVGSIHSGLKHNVISENATLELSLRYAEESTQELVLRRVEEIANAEALASGAHRQPTIQVSPLAPNTVNDSVGVERLTSCFNEKLPDLRLFDPGMGTGSEDVSWFARAAKVPLVFWFWGGIAPSAFEEAVASGRLESDVPTHHSPYFAPDPEPTLEVGIRTLSTAALEWLLDVPQGDS